MDALSNQLKSSIAALSDLTAKLPKRLNMINQEISLCDQEINDLHHVIETTRMNACDGYKAYRDLQITLIKRRELKDELVELSALRNRMNTKDLFNTHTSAILRGIRKRNNFKMKRNYNIRVRTDLVGRSKDIVIR